MKNFKLRLFVGIVPVTAIALAGWNIVERGHSVELSDLALANVEALAQNEGQGSVTAQCGKMTPVLCKAACSRCGKVFETKEYPGPAVNIEGTCSCGGTIK